LRGGNEMERGKCSDTDHNYTMPIQTIDRTISAAIAMNTAYLCTKCGDITPKKDEKDAK
jgi:hypothetical protein